MNAQCGRYSAPFSIHCSRIAICCGESVLCVDSGGMRSSTFVARMRRTSSLRSAIARHDRVLARCLGQLGDGELAQIEPQPRFARRRVGAVTLEAVLRQDRADVPVVVDLVGAKPARSGSGAAQPHRAAATAPRQGTPRVTRRCEREGRRATADDLEDCVAIASACAPLAVYSNMIFSEIPASRGRPTDAKSMSHREWKKPEFK